MDNLVGLSILFFVGLFYFSMSTVLEVRDTKMNWFFFHISQMAWTSYIMVYMGIYEGICFDTRFICMMIFWMFLYAIFKKSLRKYLLSEGADLLPNFDSRLERFGNKLELLHNGVLANKFYSSSAIKESGSYVYLTILLTNFRDKLHDIYDNRNRLDKKEIRLLNVVLDEGSGIIDSLMDNLMFEENSETAISEFSEFVDSMIVLELMYNNLMLGGESLCLLSTKES